MKVQLETSITDSERKMFEIENHDIDDYLIIDDDDESYDSDKIDSDIEAELYSTIHHEVAASESQGSDGEQKNLINIVSEEGGNGSVKDPFGRNFVTNNNLYTSFERPNKNTHCLTRQKIKNSNMPLKRKSNMISNILGNIQTHTMLPNKKQKTMNSPRKRSRVNVPPNRTVEDSDSDSSIIFIGSEELGKLDTNIAKAFNFASSDSDSSSSSTDGSITHFTSSMTRNHLLNTNSTPVSQGDPWYINNTDLFRKKRFSNRYHETAILKCTNCNKKGHLAKFCVERKILKCFICGGIHTGTECPNKICSRCFQFGHDKWHCFLRQETHCYICNMQAHRMKDCPDLWRRFHLTTSGKKIVKGKLEYRNTPIYCFNCGVQGHYGYHCKASRKGDIPPTFTSVISYRDVNIQVGSTVMNEPHPFAVGEEVRRFPAHKVSAKKRKMEKNLKRSLKALKKLENKNGLTRNMQDVNFPRSSKEEQVKCSNAEYRKRQLKKNAKMRRRQRARMRDAARLQAMHACG